VARDVVLVHMASMSNLFAAMAWTLVHLLERPDLLARVRQGDDELLDRCAHESIRLRQRSIVLRRVLQPLTLADEKTAYRVEPGVFLATMMSVTNPTALPGLDGFDPRHFEGRRFVRRDELAAPELVTTFGHGAHSCPAQGFSIAAIRRAVRELVVCYELTPRFRDPQPLRRQLGGVARADRPCRADYRAR
jgi:cytochrome P450